MPVSGRPTKAALLNITQGSSSPEVAVVLRREEAATSAQAGIPSLQRFPEKVNERFAASCRRCPRRAVAVESIEKGQGNLSITGAIWQNEGQARRPRRRKCRSRAA